MTSRTVSHTTLDVGNTVDQEFARGVLDFEMRDYSRAECRMTEVLSIGEAQEHVIVRSKAAAMLGLIELERGNLDNAFVRLDEARNQARSPLETPWARFLGSAIAAIRARLAIQDVVRQIAQTQLEVEDEINELEDEIAKFTEGVYFSIKGISPGVQEAERKHGAIAEAFTATRSVLNVRLLCQFRAFLNGSAEIRLCTNRKGQAIFMLLVTRPGTRLHKEILLELLWPRQNPGVSIGRLHTAISRLRRALRESPLGDEGLLFESDCYFMDPNFDIDSDVDGFERHANRGIHLDSAQRPKAAIVELETARSLYTGPYLEEMREEDWAVDERTRLEDRYLEVLSRLAVLHFGMSDLSSCIRICQELLRYDNLREDACRLLMQSHYVKGNRILAIRAYQDLEIALQRELGIEPDRESQQLFERIRSQQM